MTDVNGIGRDDHLRVEVPRFDTHNGAVAYVGGVGGWFTREGTVAIIEALTDLVEAHDIEEARKAAAAAREAAKFKRSDRFKILSEYVVIADEDDDGLIDLISLRSGQIEERKNADLFRRYRGNV